VNAKSADDAIEIEVVIQAPAQRVFEAIADPQQRVEWWGVEGRFQATHMESDMRVGGAWLMRGTGVNDQPFVLSGEYCVVEPPRVLEFTWIRDRSEPPTRVRFDLEEKDGATTVRLTHSGFADAASRDRYQGWPWLMALLQAYVQQKVSGNNVA
jgi:uncharacterized protein YndB with AHSA1/START domain